jgi:hypothetical protein
MALQMGWNRKEVEVRLEAKAQFEFIYGLFVYLVCLHSIGETDQPGETKKTWNII